MKSRTGREGTCQSCVQSSTQEENQRQESDMEIRRQNLRGHAAAGRAASPVAAGL